MTKKTKPKVKVRVNVNQQIEVAYKNRSIADSRIQVNGKMESRAQCIKRLTEQLMANVKN